MGTLTADDSEISRQGDAMDKSIVTKRDDKAENERPVRVEIKDSETHRELIEDLAVADQALEEYEVQGVEGATPYNEYRAKRLGTKA